MLLCSMKVTIMSTSVRIKGDTYRTIIETRGILEQTFRKKLTIDDTIYLSSRLISFIYRTFQKLEAQNKIQISAGEDGTINVTGVDEVMGEVAPEIVEEFTEINLKLGEREKKSERSTVSVSG